MGFFNFPYTNFHEMNLDWLINAFNELKSYVEQYTAVNNVSYAGVWDITKQYPQWSIVVDGEKSYLAKQAVPSGIAIDNDNYWLHMADLDPRIAGIVNEITGIRNEISSLSAKQESKRNVIIIGDSYTEGVGGTAGILPNSIADISGYNVEYYAKGGTGFVRTVEDENFKNLLDNAVAGTNFNKNSVNDVVFIGGYNDLGVETLEQEDMDNAMESLRIAVKSNFPKANVTIIDFPWINLDYNADYIWLANVIYNAANKSGFNCRVALNWLMGFQDVNYDDIHPNDNGYTILASFICATLSGGSPTTNTLYTNIVNDNADVEIYLDLESKTVTVTGHVSKPATINLFTFPEWFPGHSLFMIPFYKYGSYDSSGIVYATVFGRDVTIDPNAMGEGDYYCNLQLPYAVDEY